MTEDTIQRTKFSDLLRDVEDAPKEVIVARSEEKETLITVGDVIALGTHQATGKRGAIVEDEHGRRWFVPETDYWPGGVCNRHAIEVGDHIKLVQREVTFTRVETMAFEVLLPDDSLVFWDDDEYDDFSDDLFIEREIIPDEESR